MLVRRLQQSKNVTRDTRSSSSRTFRGGLTIGAGVGCRSQRSATLLRRLSSFACSLLSRAKMGPPFGMTSLHDACWMPHSTFDFASRSICSFMTMFSYVVAMTPRVGAFKAALLLVATNDHPKGESYRYRYSGVRLCVPVGMS